MGQVIWSPTATKEVDAIAEYISQDSRDQAVLMIQRLVEATRRLEHFPYSGKVIPEIGDKLSREIRVGNYRIMYFVDGEDVLVTRVFHGARDFKP